MGWLGRGAVIAGVLAVAGCTSPEPPRDAGQLETAALDVPLDIIAGNDVPMFLDAPDCPADCPRTTVCCRSDCSGPAVDRGCCPCAPGEIDSLSCSAERTCALAR